MSHAAVFLDRDGTLNSAVIRSGCPYPPSTPEELELIDGVPEACGALAGAGFKLVCVTNQPDIARGTQDRGTVDAINARLRELVPLDEIIVCPHDDADDCRCRKPRPGMLVESARRLGLDLGRSFMVGDRWRDVDAGHAAGTRTVFIDRGYPERQPARAPDLIVSDLKESVRWILTSAR